MTQSPPGPTRDAAAGVERARHWGGFLASGAIAFLVDGSVMELAVRLLGLAPQVARLGSVGCAMVVAWLCHRTLTFALPTRPSLDEFLRYVTAASTTALINYVVFVALLFVWPALMPLAALVIASCVATFFAYVSMRYGVFRRD
jgi:putative flippase GtrA